MTEFSILFTNIGRGRNPVETYSDIVEKILTLNKEFILFLFEADTICENFDGRKTVLEIQSSLEKKTNTQVEKIQSEDKRIGVLALHNIPNLKINNLTFEKTNNLEIPKCKSGNFWHHKMKVDAKLNGIDLTFIVAHQTSLADKNSEDFLNSKERAKQAREIFEETKKIKNPVFIIRDENTILNKDFQTELFLRKEFNLICINKNTPSVYNFHYIESDTGGINKFIIFIKPIFKLLVKILNLNLKIDSICINQIAKEKFDFEPFSFPLKFADHGLNGVFIREN